MYIEIFEPAEHVNPIRLAKRNDFGLKSKIDAVSDGYQTKKNHEMRQIYDKYNKNKENQPQVSSKPSNLDTEDLHQRLRALERNNLVKKYNRKIGQVLYEDRRL